MRVATTVPDVDSRRSFTNDSCAGGPPWTTTSRPSSSSMPSPPGTETPATAVIALIASPPRSSWIRNSVPVLVCTTTSRRSPRATMPLRLKPEPNVMPEETSRPCGVPPPARTCASVTCHSFGRVESVT